MPRGKSNKKMIIKIEIDEATAEEICRSMAVQRYAQTPEKSMPLALEEFETAENFVTSTVVARLEQDVKALRAELASRAAAQAAAAEPVDGISCK